MVGPSCNQSDEEELVHLLHNRPFTLFDSIIDKAVGNLQTIPLTRSTFNESRFPDRKSCIENYCRDKNVSFSDLQKNETSMDAFFVHTQSMFSEVVFPECFRYLGNNLPDTNLTMLALGNYEVSSDAFFDLVKNIQGTRIASLKLPKVRRFTLRKVAPRYFGDDYYSLPVATNKRRDEALIHSSCDREAKRLEHLPALLRDSQITSLDFSKNSIDLRMLSSSLIGSKITDLGLSGCCIQENVLSSLAHVLKDTEIESIDISCNRLDCKSLKLLAPGLVGTNVKALNLRNNRIGVDGMNCLGRVLKHTQINSIDVSDNDLKSGSLEEFVDCLIDSKITTLSLQDNDLSYDNLIYLERVLENTHINTFFGRPICAEKFSYSYTDHESMAAFSADSVGSEIKTIIQSGISLEALFSRIKLENTLNITSLHLCNIEKYDYLESLTIVLKDTKISSLHLSNEIHEECGSKMCNNMKNLVLSLPETNVTSLNLDGVFMYCNFLHISYILKYTQITSLNINNLYGFIESCGESLIKDLRKHYLSGELSLKTSRGGCCTTNLCLLAHLFSSINLNKFELHSFIGLENDAMKHISRGLINSNISELDLSSTRIDCCGVFYLSEVLRHTQIKSLNLSGNKIACKGAQYLADCLADTRIVELKLKSNRIAFEGAQYLAECLADTRIVELDLTSIGWEEAHQLCETVRKKPADATMVVHISSNEYIDEVDGYFLNILCYPGFLIRTDLVAMTSRHLESRRPNINKVYKKTGINQLVIEQNMDEGDYTLSELRERFNSIFNYIDDIAEVTIRDGAHFIREAVMRDFKTSIYVDALEKINFVELRTNFMNPIWDAVCKIHVTALHLDFSPTDCFQMDRLKRIVMENNIFYLNLSGNYLLINHFEDLVEVLQSSKIISLNLSNSGLEAKRIELLSRALPNTKLTYIDLHCNQGIGNAELKNLLKDVHKTSICWLSLESTSIQCSEFGLKSDSDLSPYIVQRKNTPVEFQIRYVFRELVSWNADDEQFEFTVPKDSSGMTIAHYPCLVKQLQDPIYKIHIYDYFYMQNNRRHDIHVLNRLNGFVSEMKQNFISFFESKMVQLVERFGDEYFVKLVEEFDCLNWTDFVEFLLLHCSLYYVDDEMNFLHPFIYRMLHKHNMPLYNEDLEPNKKQQIIGYFQENASIDGAQDVIDLLKKLD